MTTPLPPVSHRAVLLSVALVLLAPLAHAEPAAKTPPPDGKKVTVTAPPVIESLSASPGSIESGAAVKLRWSAPAAAYVTITADQGVDPGKFSGSSATVRPTVTTTYTVIAVNAAGSATRTITIPVSETAPRPAFILITGAPAIGLSQHHR